MTIRLFWPTDVRVCPHVCQKSRRRALCQFFRRVHVQQIQPLHTAACISLGLEALYIMLSCSFHSAFNLPLRALLPVAARAEALHSSWQGALSAYLGRRLAMQGCWYLHAWGSKARVASPIHAKNLTFSGFHSSVFF